MDFSFNNFNYCTPKNAKVKKWESAELNNRTYQDYLQRLTEIAINIYEWHNLPETIDERFLELTLVSNGASVFFKDDSVEEYLALQTMYGGNLDVYRVPNDRRAYAVNGYNKQLDNKNSVLIFNNYLRRPSLETIDLFARRLTEIERTVDTNVKGQKTPLLLKCTEKQRLTLQNLYMQYDGNEPFIFADKSLDTDGIQAINTNTPYVADKLQVLKKQIWNEALTYLGVESANTEKKERLVETEVTSNLGVVESQRYVRLNARRQACKMINTMFGLDISVDFRSNTTTIDTSENGEESSPNV